MVKTRYIRECGTCHSWYQVLSESTTTLHPSVTTASAHQILLCILQPESIQISLLHPCIHHKLMHPLCAASNWCIAFCQNHWSASGEREGDHSRSQWMIAPQHSSPWQPQYKIDPYHYGMTWHVDNMVVNGRVSSKLWGTWPYVNMVAWNMIRVVW